MRRILTADLFLPLQQELVSLLRGLDDSGWLRPTVARRWVVKDVAAHLLDTDLRRLSSQRDGYAPRSRAKDIRGYDDVLALVNDLNASWVGAAGRLSPRVIVDLLEWTGAQVAELLASLQPDDPAPISVAWAGEDCSTNWMDVGREYTEKWHHQAQIRDAVGAAPLDGRRWLAPVLALSMYALPYAFRDVGAEEGDALAVTIDGEAGGAWHIIKRAGGSCAKARWRRQRPACASTPTRRGGSSSTRSTLTRPRGASRVRATRGCAPSSSTSGR